MLNLLNLLPARSTLAGGLASVIVWLIGLALRHYDIDVPPGAVSGAVALAGALATHFTPDSLQDNAKALNVDVEKLAAVLPEIKSGPSDYPDSKDAPR